MRGRLLIVEPHRFRRYEPLYAAIEARGWKTTVKDAGEPALLDWFAKVKSFRPAPSAWRRNRTRVWSRLSRTPLAYRYRSWNCSRDLARAGGSYDLVLQVGGMYSHSWPAPQQPYAMMCDCTVKLGEGIPASGVDFESAAAARRWYDIEGQLYRRAGFIFTTSHAVRRSLIDFYGVDESRVMAVGLGANCAAAPGFVPSYDSKTILYVGYEFERKGGLVLLEAFRRVVQEIPDAQLLIAGPPRVAGPLPPNTHLLGPLGPAALSKAFARASVFVMPSYFEPYAIVWLEAMSHGLPCIGTDWCTVSEVITDGETGLIAPVGNASALAERMSFLLRRPELMRTMGQRGRERALREFTWDVVAAKIDRQLAGLIAEPGVPSGALSHPAPMPLVQASQS